MSTDDTTTTWRALLPPVKPQHREGFVRRLAKVAADCHPGQKVGVTLDDDGAGFTLALGTSR